LECFFDNPTDKTLKWGENTEDEMCLNYYLYSLTSVELLHDCVTSQCTSAQTTCLQDAECKKAYYCALACDDVPCAQACGKTAPAASQPLFAPVLTCAGQKCLKK
jgi:hypothetical protein